MNGRRTRALRRALAVFAVAMAGLAAWALLRYGVTPLAALTAAIALACIAVLLYVWRLSRRAPPTLDDVRARNREQGK